MGLKVDFDGDEAKLIRSLQKILAQQKKVIDAFKEAETSGKKAGDQSEKAFGSKSVRGLADFAAGLQAIKGGAEKLLQVFKQIREESEKAGRGLLTAAETRAQLLQVSEGDPRIFRQLTTQAEQLRATQGFTAVEANQLIFQAKSAGVSKDAEFFARLKDIGFTPESGIEAVQKLQTVFGKGPEGAGTSRQIINKLLIAAGGSPVVAQKIAQASTTASVGFANIGGGDEGLLAIGSVFAQAFKNPEAANQKIKSLSTQLFKKSELIEFEGQPLKGIELISNLSRLGSEGRLRSESGAVVDLKKFLGEANALEAIKAFEENRVDILSLRKRLLKSEEVTGVDLLGRSIQIAQADPVLRAGKQTKIDKQKRLLLEEADLGVTSLQATSLEDRGAALRREANRGTLFAEERNLLGNFLESRERTLRGEAGFVESRRTNVPGFLKDGDIIPEQTRAFGATIGFAGITLGASLREDAEEIAFRQGQENLDRERTAILSVENPINVEREFEQR